VSGVATGYIYFVRCQHYVKIGYAKDVEKRLAGLQTGNPYKLEVVATVPGTPSLERAFHKALRRKYVRGEWFELDSEVQQLIAQILVGAEAKSFLQISDLADTPNAEYRAMTRKERQKLRARFFERIEDRKRHKQRRLGNEVVLPGC